VIDCHLVTSPGEREDWRAAALASLAAEGLAPRVLEATGNAAQSRRVALATAPPQATYVTWCDPDDVVTPGALDAVRRTMQAQPGAGLYCTFEHYIDERGERIGSQAADLIATPRSIAAHPLTAHHLLVIRADLLPRLLPGMARHATGEGWYLAAAAAALGGVVRVPSWGYSWRQRPDIATSSSVAPRACIHPKISKTCHFSKLLPIAPSLWRKGRKNS